MPPMERRVAVMVAPVRNRMPYKMMVAGMPT
jgi:hypothetical protein